MREFVAPGLVDVCRKLGQGFGLKKSRGDSKGTKLWELKMADVRV